MGLAFQGFAPDGGARVITAAVVLYLRSLPPAEITDDAEFWTAERVALLRRFYQEGLSFNLIARRLASATGKQVTRNRAMGKVYRLGLERPATLKVLRGGKPKQSRPPRVELAPDPVVTSDQGLRVVEMELDLCKWPIGMAGDEWRMCGDPQREGSPYCAHHHRVAYPKQRRVGA